MSPSRQSAGGRSFGLRFLIRLIGWSFSAAFALIVLTYLALPAILRYGLPHALARYGVASSVEGARISLTNEQVTLVGFRVGQAGGPAIRWGEVTARVDMAELLKGNIRIIDFQVKDAKVDLEQLQASEWRPPDSAAAIPELGKLNIDVGEVVLRDLEFIGLSEQVGRKVELRSLSVGSLSHLEAGARVAFQLEGVVGNGSLRLAGQARMVENLPEFEGRYELGALDLTGFGRLFGLATPRSVGGKVDGNGTFGLAYLQGEGVIRTDFSGSIGVDGLELDSGETSITRTKAEWSGDGEVFWPVAGGPPRFVARGSLESPALEAARRTTTAPYAILVRGLRWSGEMRHERKFETGGKLSGDLLRIRASHSGEPEIEMELSRLSADSEFRSGRGRYEFEAAKLAAESAKLTQTLDRGRQSVVAFRLLLEAVRLGSDGYHIGSLEAESAEAMEMGAAEIKRSRSARFISLGASGIEFRTGAGALIEQIKADQAGFDLDEVSIRLSQVGARGVKTGIEVPFRAGAVSAASLRQKTGVFETWGSNLRLSNAEISASGEVISDGATADSLSQTISADPLWEASVVQATRLTVGSSQLEASNLSTGRFAYGKFGEKLIEIERGEGADFSIRYGLGIEAGSVKLGSMRYRSGQYAVLEFAAAKLEAPTITFQGELSAKHINAGSARYMDTDANVSVVEMLKLGEISGRISSGIRIDAVLATRFSHDRAAGADFDATGVELSSLEFSGDFEASAVAGRLDSLEAALADGARLALEDVALAHPTGDDAGKFAVDGGRVRTLSYSMPGERILKLLDIELGAIGGDENDVHRISSISAASATASDPAVGGKLEIGALRIAAIRIAADMTMRADVAGANAISLAGFEGNPSAAFTGARINLNALDFNKGEPLRFGEVLLEDASLTLVLDEQGEFVLPRLPFFSEGSESTVPLVIERLETRQPARLSFVDRSTYPPFEAVISPLQMRVENYHGDDPGRRAKFELEGSMDALSNIKASGEFSTEKGGVNLQVTGKISAVELNRFNTYAAKHVKRAVSSGRGDAAFDIEVSGRKLSGTIRFVFSKVKFDQAEASSKAGGGSQAELSLQNSFAMLKDNDGIVRLTVPLSGSLDDPKFDFSDGLVQAVIRTLRNTVMMTFKPLGLLIGAAGPSSASEGLKFGSVAFDPGEHTLNVEGIAHLEALARQLKKHPGVEVQVCGRAVSADRIRIEQRSSEALSGAGPPADQGTPGSARVDFLLQDVAQKRASAVRRYLAEDQQIPQERLIACEARVESTPGRLPRVDLPVRVETELNAAPADGSRG